jgi:multidrug efflux pump subunit AcrB
MLTTSREGRSRVGRAADAAFTALERFYAKVLASCLRFPKVVLLVAAVVLVASAGLVKLIPTEFVPSQDQSRLTVRVQTEGGSSIEAAAPLLAKVEERLEKHAEIEHTMVTLSGGSGQYTLNLVPPGERKLSSLELMAVRKELQHSGRSRRFRIRRNRAGAAMARHLRRLGSAGRRVDQAQADPRRAASRPI